VAIAVAARGCWADRGFGVCGDRAGGSGVDGLEEPAAFPSGYVSSGDSFVAVLRHQCGADTVSAAGVGGVQRADSVYDSGVPDRGDWSRGVGAAGGAAVALGSGAGDVAAGGICDHAISAAVQGADVEFGWDGADPGQRHARPGAVRRHPVFGRGVVVAAGSAQSDGDRGGVADDVTQAVPHTR